MFAIAFDMVIPDLKKYYGEPYNNAYYEICGILEKYQFYNTQESVYLSTNNDMSNLVRAIVALKNIVWLGAFQIVASPYNGGVIFRNCLKLE
jgi:virulence-associated protein VapD